MKATQTRSFEFNDEKSSKFWEVIQAQGSVTVRYGKKGTNGQSQVKEFTDEAAARVHVQKLIAGKLGKGYEELVAAPSDSSASVVPATKAENGNPAIKMQNDKCCMLRDQILQFLTNHPELGEDEESGFNHAKTILNRLHYLENSFKFDQKECTLEQVDRTVSMFSGPLYCSDKYPQARDALNNRSPIGVAVG